MMKDFFCETLELEFRVSPEAFKRDVFEAEAKNARRKEGLRYGFACGSQVSPDEQHAHLVADLRGTKHYRFTVTYHSFPGDTRDLGPPYMEDCASWLHQFIKDDEVKVTLTAIYSFDQRFAPVVPLPFPLVVGNKQLAGSKVTGLSLQLPTKTGIRRAILERERDKDVTSIQIETGLKVKLGEVTIESLLADLAIAVMALVSPVREETEAK